MSYVLKSKVVEIYEGNGSTVVHVRYTIGDSEKVNLIGNGEMFYTDINPSGVNVEDTIDDLLTEIDAAISEREGL